MGVRRWKDRRCHTHHQTAEGESFDIAECEVDCKRTVSRRKMPSFSSVPKLTQLLRIPSGGGALVGVVGGGSSSHKAGVPKKGKLLTLRQPRSKLHSSISGQP